MMRLFDKLSSTETYASKQLKQRPIMHKDPGRPLYSIEIEPDYQCPILKSVSCESSTSTATDFSYSYPRSSNSRNQIFDRLASTGTFSSLCKLRKSKVFDEEDRTETYNDAAGTVLLREFKGITRLSAKRSTAKERTRRIKRYDRNTRQTQNARVNQPRISSPRLWNEI